MRVKDKIWMERDQLEEYGPITIVAFGDSVTHGAVGPDEMDYETVYWNRLKKKILEIRNYVPVNVINAGISGITAKQSLGRMDKQVFAHNPDLVIVCFGLNDVNGSLEDYIESLEAILKKCKACEAETIFMTPNMLNTRVSDEVEEQYKDYAYKTAEMQNSGRMDQFMKAACELAKRLDVPICDCYAKWKVMSETQDITDLLANRINHPTKEMHEMFASSLFELIFDSNEKREGLDDNTMFDGAM